MQTDAIVSHIIADLEKELAAASHAARESADEATDDESRPENKYDTHALETSYVASAQAHYAKDLKTALQAYHNLSLPDTPSERVALGSLVSVLGPNGSERFFIGPAHGGLEIEAEDGPITVLTPKSPLGAQLIGKGIGDRVGERKILRLQ